MIADGPQKAIENYVDTLLKNTPDVFVVEVRINAGNSIIVFLDADNGITIEKCAQVNRALYKYIEENSLFENGNFSLEVSSPGVDEPLKLRRQYTKNIGRKIEVLLNDQLKKEGKLLAANEEEIVIEETAPKIKKFRHPASGSSEHRSDEAQVTEKKTIISYNQIRHTKVLVTF